MPTPLTDVEQTILSIESKLWLHAGQKEQAIRDQLDMSSTRFYSLLNALIETESALAHSPALVNRLRRLRDSRQRSRSVRR